MKRSIIAVCAIILLSPCINSCNDQSKSTSPNTKQTTTEVKTESAVTNERKKDSATILLAESEIRVEENKDTRYSERKPKPSVKKIAQPKTETSDQSAIDEGKALIAKSDCLACHRLQEKLVGPSYADVAGKYSFNNTTVEFLAGKIVSGGIGVWGQVPMIPHPGLTPEVAKKMVAYILSLKR